MPNDPITNAALAGAIWGALIGIFPLFMGIRFDRFIIGGIGLGLSLALGLIFGLFASVPISLLFASIIYITRRV